MPASSHNTESLAPLEASLKASLGIKDNLDQRIAASSLKKVLFQKVDFVEAEKTALHQLDKLKSKYVFLSGKKAAVQSDRNEFQKPASVMDTMPQPSSSHSPAAVNGKLSFFSVHIFSALGPNLIYLLCTGHVYVKISEK